jgi:hypothetical protein
MRERRWASRMGDSCDAATGSLSPFQEDRWHPSKMEKTE